LQKKPNSTKEIKPLTPLKAIRAKCLECCAGQALEVRECQVTDCPIYRYRMGKHPDRRGKGGRKDWIK